MEKLVSFRCSFSGTVEDLSIKTLFATKHRANFGVQADWFVPALIGNKYKTDTVFSVTVSYADESVMEADLLALMQDAHSMLGITLTRL